MLHKYLVIAWRNLLKHKVFSFINIFGLALGMAACLLILQYVHVELSFDNFHENADRIYRVRLTNYANGKLAFQNAAVFPTVGPTMKNDFPEVEAYGRLYSPVAYGSCVVKYEDKKFFEKKLYYADASLLKIFSIPLLKRSSQQVLQSPDEVILSESTAEKYFGTQNPLGKQLTLHDEYGRNTYIVSGVFEDIPQNSHLQFDFLFSLGALTRLTNGYVNNSWEWSDFYTYVLVKPGTQARQLQAKLPAFVNTYKPDLAKNQRKEELHLQALSDIHLYSAYSQEAQANGSAQIVYALLIIALFVLLIAWVNYINLSTARATQRAKEVGIRKAVGSRQWQLIYQFLVESLLINGLATIAAFTLIQFIFPLFSQLTGQQLGFTLWQQPLFWQTFVLLLLAGSVISGIYPAFVLSSFKPVMVLKGGMVSAKAGNSIRKGLVVFQFAVSICLIAGTLVVYEQIRFMRAYNLGVNTHQIVVVKAPVVMDVKNDSVYNTSITRFKKLLEPNSAFKQITVTSHIPGDEITGDNIRRESAPAGQSYFIKNLSVDQDYIPAYSLNVRAGRNFSKDFIADKESVILNEAAVQMLGFASPEAAINEKVVLLGGTKKVIGVIHNYYHNIHSVTAQTPIVLQLSYWNSTYISMKINSKEAERSIGLAKAAYEEVYPGNPFSYFFLDEFFDEQFKADKQFGKVFGLFSGLAICIACMGLFGLASLIIEQRMKEVGVRKVLGASAANIVALLSKDFIRLILLANLIAWPLTYWGIYKWLENYAFRMEIHFWLFILPALLVLLIALFTISVQTLKAARANPVNTLKYE